MIVICKAAARPAQHGHLQHLQCLEHILTIAVDVRDLRILTYPETAIDTRSQMLRELTVNLFVNLGSGLVGMNRCFHVLGCYACGKCHCDSRSKE